MFRFNFQNNSAKKIVVIVITFAIAGAFLYQKSGVPLTATYKYSSVSPSGKYKIDVYSNPIYFAMPGQGGAGSHLATVVLRNSWGWKIGSNYGCDLFMDNVNIEWNESEGYVSIALAKQIDLNSGQCSE